MKLSINHTENLTIIVGLIILLFAKPSFGQDTTKNESERKYSFQGIAGAPYIRYEPETGWVGGLVGMYYFHLGPDRDDKLTRPSSVSAGLSYSELHQSTIGINYDIYFPHDEYRVYGGFHFQQFPLDFFGIGDHTPKNNIDEYTPIYRGFTFDITKNLFRSKYGEGLNIGIQGEFRNDHVIKSDPGGVISTNQVPGAQGGVANGLGVIGIYDTRDNTYSTQIGQYESLDAMFYGKALGSDYSIVRYTADVRKFYTVAENQVVALQAYAVLSNGNVPFYMMRGLGGDQLLRGYYLLRFRDDDVGLLQGEYRFPIWWRFGGVVFAGLGEVGYKLSDFTWGGIHPSYGAGLRLLVVKSEHLNARLDYGFGSDSHELYLAILEAF